MTIYTPLTLPQSRWDDFMDGKWAGLIRKYLLCACGVLLVAGNLYQ